MGQVKSALAITVAEYATMNDKSWIDEMVVHSIPPSEILPFGKFRVKPKQSNFWLFSWSELILIRDAAMKNDFIAVIGMVYSFSPQNVLKLNVFSCFSSFKWVIEQINKIERVEQKEFDYDPSQEEIDAGVEDLQKYKHFNALESLTNKDASKEHLYLDMPYQEVFMRLSKHKKENEIQKNLIENASRKAKRG